MALRDITLGQFFPGTSLIHNLDPRTKIIALTCYIIALFCADSALTYVIMFGVLALAIGLSKVPISAIFKGMKPLIFILTFTGLLNMFYVPGETVLLTIWKLTITLEGLVVAFYMVIRIMMLVSGSFLLTYTTSPIRLTDGLEQLLNPLKVLKVPVHDLSMMMSIALRFIPNLIEETDKIMSAQRARGANFESGGIVARAQAMVPLLVPLFVSALRRAIELADAMDCRCYHGGEGRTRMTALKYRKGDYLVIVFVISLVALVLLLGHFGL
ncbi:MAG: energy-coupling factor transporter transmembrane component T [Eubacteriales bacterium]